MASGPTRFDDEDGAAPDQPLVRTEPAELDHAGAASGTRRGGPNYFFRRAVVVGGVVAVIATASIVIGQLIGTGSNDTASGAVGSEWNRIVLVDDRTGRVIVDDATGEELARIESGVRNPTASAVVNSTLVVAGQVVAVIDLTGETVEEFDVAADRIVTPTGSALVRIAPRSDGGRAILVHGPSGEVIDTDTFAPVVGARYEFADSLSPPSGRDLLVTDSGNFQSVLFSFEREEPSFFPGLALALDDEIVVTAQNVGNEATISVFDHDGEPITTARTPSVRAGMITDAGVVLVTVDGAVLTMSTANGETADEAQLEIAPIESGDITTGGDRLVITAAAGTAIVENDGAVIGTYPTERPTGSSQPPTGSTCIATLTDAEDAAQISVIDLTDGAVVAEAMGVEPVLTDASGCVVGVTTSDGFTVLGSEVLLDLDTDDRLLGITLDGSGVATERDGRILLLSTGGDTSSDEPIDLGPGGRSVHFTQS